VELVGFAELHAPFFMERRTRGSLQCSVAGNPGPGLLPFYDLLSSSHADSVALLGGVGYGRAKAVP